MFRPERIPRNEMDEIIQDCIQGSISPNADITEIKFWASYLPEALRYCYRKRKKIVRSIEELELRLDEIDAKVKLVYIHSSMAKGSITEKKDFAEAMKKARSKEYKEYKKNVVVFNELLASCDADIINLEQKSYMIRKFSNFEAQDRIYQTD